MATFQEAKRQQGVEPKIVRLEGKIDVDRVLIPTGRKYLSGKIMIRITVCREGCLAGTNR